MKDRMGSSKGVFFFQMDDLMSSEMKLPNYVLINNSNNSNKGDANNSMCSRHCAVLYDIFTFTFFPTLHSQHMHLHAPPPNVLSHLQILLHAEFLS